MNERLFPQQHARNYTHMHVRKREHAVMATFDIIKLIHIFSGDTFHKIPSIHIV